MRSRPGASSSRQFGRMVQHRRGTPRISQILKRKKLRTQTFRELKLSASTGIEKHLTQPWRDAARASCETRQLPITHMRNRWPFANAADDKSSINSRQKGFKVWIVGWVCSHKSIIDSYTHLVIYQACHSIEPFLFIRSKTHLVF